MHHERSASSRSRAAPRGHLPLSSTTSGGRGVPSPAFGPPPGLRPCRCPGSRRSESLNSLNSAHRGRWASGVRLCVRMRSRAAAARARRCSCSRSGDLALVRCAAPSHSAPSREGCWCHRRCEGLMILALVGFHCQRNSAFSTSRDVQFTTAWRSYIFKQTAWCGISADGPSTPASAAERAERPAPLAHTHTPRTPGEWCVAVCCM